MGSGLRQRGSARWRPAGIAGSNVKGMHVAVAVASAPAAMAAELEAVAAAVRGLPEAVVEREEHGDGRRRRRRGARSGGPRRVGRLQ